MDGWSRDFAVEQTVMEARAAGYECTINSIKREFRILDAQYQQHCLEEVIEVMGPQAVYFH